jgi:hypothetical protein
MQINNGRKVHMDEGTKNPGPIKGFRTVRKMEWQEVKHKIDGRIDGVHKM